MKSGSGHVCPAKNPNSTHFHLAPGPFKNLQKSLEITRPCRKQLSVEGVMGPSSACSPSWSGHVRRMGLRENLTRKPRFWMVLTCVYYQIPSVLVKVPWPNSRISWFVDVRTAIIMSTYHDWFKQDFRFRDYLILWLYSFFFPGSVLLLSS